jgi:hypothetical protein
MFVQCDFTFHVFIVVPHARLAAVRSFLRWLCGAVAADRLAAIKVDNLGLGSLFFSLLEKTVDRMTPLRFVAVFRDLDSWAFWFAWGTGTSTGNCSIIGTSVAIISVPRSAVPK